jgi:hypothetical protein
MTPEPSSFGAPAVKVGRAPHHGRPAACSAAWRGASRVIGVVAYGLVLLACETLGPSQALSEECDPDLGIDACGAGLFCEAFDGREVYTCYELRSRLPGEECSASEQCVNQKCGGGICLKALVGEPCAVDEDCHEGLKCSGVCYSGGTGTGTGPSTSTGTSTGF